MIDPITTPTLKVHILFDDVIDNVIDSNGETSHSNSVRLSVLSHLSLLFRILSKYSKGSERETQPYPSRLSSGVLEIQSDM